MHMRKIGKTLVLSMALSGIAALSVAQNQPNANVNAIIQHGEQLNAQSKYDEAIVEFKRALDLDAHNSHALFRMAEAQSKLGNLSAALNTLKAAVEGDRQPKWTEVWAYVNIGRIYDIRGQRYRAIPMYRQAVDTGDDSFSAQAEAKKCLDKPCEDRILTWPSP